MRNCKNLLVAIALAAICGHLAVQDAIAACGCGNPSPCSCSTPTCVHTHCHYCCRSNCRDRGCCNRDRDATRNAASDFRSAAPIPVVASMPVFQAPMMMTSVPVMPTTFTRAAYENTRSAERTRSAFDLTDCERRLNQLERDSRDIVDAIKTLQGIVEDQTKAMAKISETVKRLDKKANEKKDD